jgi:two-component system, response regulator PdtaR
MPKTKILIVEDEGIPAMELQDKLENWGYEVPGIANSGEMAIEMALQSKPHLILMDIMLKGEIDGIEAAKKILDNLDLKVIYLTAHSDKKTLERAKNTNSHSYLLKPFDDKELKSSIETALK